mmetsp:Transcript_52622/g.87379  ORF Transcript_52622/g.87379 Transcript_52622/m.87379 type:complete len:257 (-) Transcript_52622:342-1112(-)
MHELCRLRQTAAGTRWSWRSSGVADAEAANIPARDEPHPYSRANYWEQRYVDRSDGHGDCKTFEWYAGFEILQPVLEASLKTSMRVLHVGSGNSKLPEDMWKFGFRNQVGSDISPSVVAHMTRRTIGMEGLEWLVFDCLASGLPGWPPQGELAPPSGSTFADGQFDAVIDKGTFDAFSCGGNELCKQLLTEARRLLRKGGVYILITPLSVCPLLQPPWAHANLWEPVVVTRVSNALQTVHVHVATKPDDFLYAWQL